MFYILSKTLGMLSQPIYWCLILIIAFLLTKNKHRKKRLGITLLAILYLTSNNFLVNETMRLWEMPAVPMAEMNKTYEVGIVLGGSMGGHRTPRDRFYTNKGADRILHAAVLYHKGVIKKIMVTGGYILLTGTQEYTEADDMEALLNLCGVPDSVIIKEGASANTRENALFCQEILQKTYANDEKYLLITSAFHMRRSLGCFEKVGLLVDPFPTDFYTSDTVLHWGIPFDQSADALMAFSKLGKEWLGMISYWAAGYI